MTWEYLHLISHSFPIVLSVTGAVAGLAGWMAGREELERWGLLAFLVAGVFVVPAYVTGLAAADVVGDRLFVRPSLIQRHRTWATFAAVPLVVAAILAGFSFAEPADRRLRRFVILVGVVAAAMTGFAATLGARIEHGPELDGEAAAQALEPEQRIDADVTRSTRSLPTDEPVAFRPPVDPAVAGRPGPSAPGGRGG